MHIERNNCELSQIREPQQLKWEDSEEEAQIASWNPSAFDFEPARSLSPASSISIIYGKGHLINFTIFLIILSF